VLIISVIDYGNQAYSYGGPIKSEAELACLAQPFPLLKTFASWPSVTNPNTDAEIVEGFVFVRDPDKENTDQQETYMAGGLRICLASATMPHNYSVFQISNRVLSCDKMDDSIIQSAQAFVIEGIWHLQNECYDNLAAQTLLSWYLELGWYRFAK
jgi:hypothetical protein